MSDTLIEGQLVQIVDREATEEDAKSGLFYNFYRGLTGTVQKVYATNDEVAMTVDLLSFPDAIATRHEEMRQAMKAKWLDGLSEEARGRLTDAEKDFTLRYSVLLQTKDIRPIAEGQIAAAKPAAKIEAAPDEPRRRTSAEIEADEEAYLRSRQEQP